jgi:phage/plasmid-like protein (TIGR03299 family)
MPAGFEANDNMMSVRQVPWHGMGAVLDAYPKSVAEALQLSGLDWTVQQEPVVYLDAGEQPVEVPGQLVNVRSDDGTPLGVVSERYTVLQNVDAFRFIDNLIGSDLHFETAGSLSGGKHVWVMARLPEYVEIGGDATGMYVFISNSHDGCRAVKAAVSPIRVVCQNTLRAALQGAKNTYSVTHIGDPTQRLHEARAVLEVTIDYGKQFKQFGDQLASQKVTERQLKKVLEELYPTKAPNITDRVKNNRVDAQNWITWNFREGPTVGNAPESKWAFVNSICEFVDYGTATDHDGKLTRAITDPSGIKRRAFELVAA